MNTVSTDKLLEAKILSFRHKLLQAIEKKISDNVQSLGETLQPHHIQEARNHSLIKLYDEHFGIKHDHGKTS